MSSPKKTLPTGWETAMLRDACEIIMGQSPPSSTYRSEKEGLPFFQGKAEFGQLYPTPRKWCAAPNKIAEAEDILLSIRAPVGPTNLAPERCCIGRGLAALRTRDETIGRFLLHQLRCLEGELESLATGTTFRAVTGKTVSQFEIRIAPLPEQRRIVAKIESLQARSRRAREALSEVRPLLEQFRQRILAAAFRGDLTADWREQNPDVEPASELLQRIRKERRKKWEEAELAKYEAKGKKPPKGWKDRYRDPEPVDESELPELPEGWTVASLETLTTLITDGKHGDCKDEAGSGYYFLSVKDVRDGRLHYEDARQINKTEFLEVHQRTNLQVGDVLITNAGTIGRVAVATDERKVLHTTFQKSVAVTKPIRSGVNAEYLSFFLQHHVRELQAKSSGTAVKNLLLRDLRAVRVPVVPHTEQAELVRIVRRAFEAIVETQQEVAQSESSLTHLDQSVLAKAFRGELVPQDPNDEPASVLLERIRQQREASDRHSRRPKQRGKSSTP